MASSSSLPPARKSIWHYQGSVVFSPLFDWPPRPVPALVSLVKRWVTFSRNVLFLLMAMFVYLLLVPELSAMATLSWQWVLRIFVTNLVLMTLVAGGLHWYLFVLRGQGKTAKFDPREEHETSKKFTFHKQVHDNVFWSLASGVSIWTLYEVLYFWGAANGVIPTVDFASHPVAFFVWLLVLPYWTSTHFFLIHRLLHWPPIFQSVHRLHHRNIHIGPWSGMSMHPVEHLFYISSVVVHFLIASHPLIFMFHVYQRCLAPAFSHAGFEQLVVKDKVVTDAADFHHQLHHRYYECNYGSVDAPWDRWFGYVHDGSEQGTLRVHERRREMYRSKKAAIIEP